MNQKSVKRLKPWLAMLLFTDVFFAFLVWLAAPSAFQHFIVIICLFTIIVSITGYFVDRKIRQKQKMALQDFLNNLSEESEQLLLEEVDESWHAVIQTASVQWRGQSQRLKDKQLELQNYQEFMESWIHEVKTPLSLATLILDNRKEEMSPYVYNRMEHVRYTINREVERILYYARLESDHVEYKFVKMSLRDCVQECFWDFGAIIEEKGLHVQLELSSLQIVSDRKVLIFIIGQLLSNAFKYAAPEGGMAHIVSWMDTQNGGNIHLTIRNNGKAVPEEDVPFLFDKGFTGNHSDRQSATGMGLYFVKKYAKALSVEVKLEPVCATGEGFGIELIFPHVV